MAVVVTARRASEEAEEAWWSALVLFLNFTLKSNFILINHFQSIQSRRKPVQENDAAPCEILEQKLSSC